MRSVKRGTLSTPAGSSACWTGPDGLDALTRPCVVRLSWLESGWVLVETCFVGTVGLFISCGLGLGFVGGSCLVSSDCGDSVRSDDAELTLLRLVTSMSFSFLFPIPCAFHDARRVMV